MARMHELASASPPYERVPNILLYTFNNLICLFTILKHFRNAPLTKMIVSSLIVIIFTWR